MGISDKIESFILELLKEDDDWLEIGRNELASVFNCVPSQINYVISTRFSPERGYMVESRRGGGGYLRIKRVIAADDNILYDTVMRIGNRIDFPTAKSIVAYLTTAGAIDEQNAKLMLGAMCEKSLPVAQNEIIRANIFKNMLMTLI